VITDAAIEGLVDVGGGTVVVLINWVLVVESWVDVAGGTEVVLVDRVLVVES